MKNYKILIISLLLLVFMVGAVSAADENVTDDNLEITDDISVDEAVASDVEEIEEDDSNIQEELGAVDTQGNSFDDEILKEDNSNAQVVYPDDSPDLEQINVFYGEEKYFTVQFLHYDNTPYSNLDVKFYVYDLVNENCTIYNSSTDDEGYASLLIDWPIGSYAVGDYILGEEEFALYAPIKVFAEGAEDPIVIIPEEQVDTVEGFEKNFTLQFVNNLGNIPYSNANVTLTFGNYYDGSSFTREYKTDENGYVTFPIDFPVGGYVIADYTLNGNSIGGAETGIFAMINVYSIEDDVPMAIMPSVITYKLLYGEKMNFTFQIIRSISQTPFANTNVEIPISADSTQKLEVVTDENGFINLPIDFPIGHYYISRFTVEGFPETNLWFNQISFHIYDPEIIGTMNYNYNNNMYDSGNGSAVIVYGESFQFNVYLINVTEDPVSNAVVQYSVNNMNGTVTTAANGWGSVTIDSLPVGAHTIIIKFPEFNLTSNHTIHVIPEKIPTILAENLTVVGGDGTQFVAKVTDKFGNPIANLYTQLREGYRTIATSTSDENGIVTYTVNLKVGVHTVGITNSKTHETLQWTIRVLNQTSIVDNDAVDEDSISISFADENGTALANSEVKFLVGDETYNVTTDANGVATFDLSVLGLGEFDITVLNPLTGQKVTKSVSLTTNETVFADDVTAVYNDASNFSAKFTDKYGKALINTTVAFKVNDQVINATTDENGIASFINSNFNVGNNTIVISNPVTGNEISKTLTINKAATALKANAVSMVYNVPKALLITLTDAQGNAIANQKVTVLLNGKTYNGATNDKGQLSVNVNLPAKSYAATVKFEGDNNYIDAQTTAKVTVTKATPKMTAKKAKFKAKAKTKKYSIVLKDNKGKAMKKVKVTLKVKGKTYKAKTNAKGKATFKIKKLTKKGKYTAKVKFAGNTNFKKVTKSVKLTVR